jgi:broad specificity phosphatase PhoE
LQPARLLLVRHGQTAWNVERRFLGRTDIPLDATGEAQAARLGQRLAAERFDALWASPLARARQTAAVLGQPRTTAGFIEMDMGELEGLSGSEAPHAVSLPGGECLVDVQARGLRAFAELTRDLQPGQQAVVVTHQLVLATLVCHLAGAPLADFRTFMHKNTGITTVLLEERPRLLSINDAAHLEG